MSTSPAPTPQKSSNLVWWLLGIFCAAVVVLGLGGLLVARYFVQQVRVQDAGRQVEIHTPAGELKVAKDLTKDPGLPVYPGATLVEPGARVEITAPNEEAVGVTAARYRTIDPIANVDAWYREHLGVDFTREGPGVSTRKKDVFGIEVKSDDIAFISEKNDLLRVVVLERKRGAVEIALARIGKHEAQ